VGYPEPSTVATPSIDTPLDSPDHWTGSTHLLDLQDPRIRLRAQSLTQLCHTERERALAIYGFVKRLPFAKPFKLRFRTAREVIDLGRGDADDKGTLFVALLRAAGFAARLCYLEMPGGMLRGLTDSPDSAGRPLVQVWMGGRWSTTDTYIFDAAYAVAARRRLNEQGWDCGYGLHRDGQTLWDGLGDAFVAGGPSSSLGVLGVFHDPADLVASAAFKTRFPAIGQTMRWGLLARAMDRGVTRLRGESGAITLDAQQTLV
jgi:transglutaminase-like putative cysteine protease